MKLLNNELQIEEDLKMQRRTWQVQRIAWIVLTLFILAAALGLFGQGKIKGVSILNKSSADKNIEVEYQLSLRKDAPDRLKVTLSGATIAENESRIGINRNFFEKVKITKISPRPKSEQVMQQAVVYVFDVPVQAATIDVYFEIEPYSTGNLSTTFSTAGGSSVSVKQFIFP